MEEGEGLVSRLERVRCQRRMATYIRLRNVNKKSVAGIKPGKDRSSFVVR